MKSNITVDPVIKDDLCTGCGTCAGLCPISAIEMVKNESRGIYIPQLDEGKCNECGVCFNACPGHAVDFKQLNSEIFGKQPEDMLLGNYINCYVGHAADQDIRYNAASGGLVTALLIFALEELIIDGALVTRMNPDYPLKPLPFIARTREEIISAARSKYCPVPANIALQGILNSKDGEKFAVVGLPCHIQGLRKAAAVIKRLMEKIVLHLGIICSNSNSFSMTDFILWQYGIKKESVAHLDYRGQGWPGYMTIHFKNGAMKRIPYQESMAVHGFGLFTPRRCTVCYETTCELADISFGDAWGFPEFAQDTVGKSLIISRSTEGENFLQKAISSGRVMLSEITHNRAYAGNKRANLKARFSLNRLAGKRVPIYHVQIERPKPAAYPYYLLLYLNMYFSSKRQFWRLIPFLSRLEQVVFKRLVKHFQ